MFWVWIQVEQRTEIFSRYVLLYVYVLYVPRSKFIFVLIFNSFFVFRIIKN